MAMADLAADWYRAHVALPTRCTLPAVAIASQAFQDHPLRLELSWVRDEHEDFLRRIAEVSGPDERGQIFHDYCLARFWLHEDHECWPTERERLRRSYIAVLRGWSHDSNGPSGAMLKGWAEQRFGLRPIWHGADLLTDQDQAAVYHGSRLRGHVAGIGHQLDLLYTFVQDELARRHGDQRWLTLYRGTHDPEQYEVKHDNEQRLVEFNCVSSFTDDPEIAWEFGSAVWRVRVPLAKIVVGPDLLPTGLLGSEREYVVLGGDYVVEVLKF